LPKPPIATSRRAASLTGDRGKRGVDDARNLPASDARVRRDLLCELVLGHTMLGVKSQDVV
jgi:hypothetical protein